MKKFYLHYSGLKVARDGEVFVPKSGKNPPHYTYGGKTTSGHRRVQYEGKTYLVHVLVAEVFLNNNQPIDTNTYAVHHINENPEDNRPENLLIITHPEHTALHNSERKGENNPFYGKHHTEESRKKMSTPIIGTNLKTGETREFVGAREASRVLGLDFSSITKCCKGKLKSTGGWRFEYAA